jgi:uroporphyrinogen decarboxylase
VNDRFLRACRRQPVDATPVWFMRQAGRYMPEYRALRQQFSLLELCRTPELAAQVTRQPVDALEIDAAILFSDLLLPLEPMGLTFDFVQGEGPAFDNPIRSAADVARVRPIDPAASLSYVLDTIRQLKPTLDVPLIGFVGAPFTLASYAIEGGPSKDFARTKAMMYTEPEAWRTLCTRLAEMAGAYLRAQIAAGVDAVQVFDSWVGQLGPSDYREFALPYTRLVFQAIADLDVPSIHFGVGTAMLLEDMTTAGSTVVGADWRTPLDRAWQLIGSDRAIQGNLDPTLLLGPWPRLRAAVEDIVERAAGRPGHIFNLGHGVLPMTSPEAVQRVAHLVHTLTAASRR